MTTLTVEHLKELAVRGVCTVLVPHAVKPKGLSYEDWAWKLYYIEGCKIINQNTTHESNENE
jgi:hypothetical protein